jgi:hypothetical protein
MVAGAEMGEMAVVVAGAGRGEMAVVVAVAVAVARRVV